MTKIRPIAGIIFLIAGVTLLLGTSHKDATPAIGLLMLFIGLRDIALSLNK